VHTFCQGESFVNNYRYKFKANGKWKVMSAYIPADKLQKVREATATNLGASVAVTGIWISYCKSTQV